MSNLNPGMRLKVKGDTFFLPDPNGSVYFRNNVGSFRMEGSMIDQWIEKLLPMFNGEHTMEDLTDGLPDEYRDRIYEIAESLYQNGFVRDVSEDRPHQLEDEILNKYASQIEFLDTFGGSGAYRFQHYRQDKVLAVGSGPFFVSLVAALLESGLPQFHLLITDSLPTNRERLQELAEHARKTDPDVSIKEIYLKNEEADSWRDAVRTFDSILYVSQEGNIEELRLLHSVCREEGKLLLPGLFVQQVGMAGPLVHPDSEGCWESAWRRVHESALSKDPQLHSFSTTTGAMLANVLVFELIKTVTGVAESELKNKFYLLNLETLEGNWHPFIPHPLVTERTSVEWVQDLDLLLEQNTTETKELIPYFSTLTSAESGIFHNWEEGDLKQLPLALCRVQAVDPISKGPAALLPSIVCSGLTHEEARREAGLTGLETYASQMVNLLVDKELQEFVGVGVGETVAEAVCRGLQKWLATEMKNELNTKKRTAKRAQLSKVEDERCQFYLDALTILEGEPLIGIGEMIGFPVVWVGTGEHWYGSVELNITLALRNALQLALIKEQHQDESHLCSLEAVHLEEKELQSIEIPTYGEDGGLALLQTARKVITENRKRLLVADLKLEPFFKDELAGVFAVLLREEETR